MGAKIALQGTRLILQAKWFCNFNLLWCYIHFVHNPPVHGFVWTLLTKAKNGKPYRLEVRCAASGSGSRPYCK